MKKTELQIQRAVALLRETYRGMVEGPIPDEEGGAVLALLGFGDWILGKQSEEADVFDKMFRGMRAVMRRHGEQN